MDDKESLDNVERQFGVTKVENEKESNVKEAAREDESSLHPDGDNSGSNTESKAGFLKRVFLFLSQVVRELKATTWPTKNELVSYTIIVLLFVIVMMIILAVWDFALGRLFFEIFGG